jgi:hypothetical protein
VSIVDDGAAEPNEKFNLVLSSPAGATLPDPVGTATIWASDQPTVSAPVISVDNIVVGEADGFADFVVRLNAPSTGAVSVNYSNSNATAANGSDYIAVSGTLTFAPGEMVKTVRVPIIDDTVAESTESFTLQLSSPSGATIGQAVSVATIVDNDGTPPPADHGAARRQAAARCRHFGKRAEHLGRRRYQRRSIGRYGCRDGPRFRRGPDRHLHGDGHRSAGSVVGVGERDYRLGDD